MRVVVRISSDDLAQQVRVVLSSAGHELIEGEPAHELMLIDAVVTDDIRRVEKLRAAYPALPILMIAPSESAPADVLARVAALRAGADDAMTAPFHGSQMVARVDALGRRGALIPRDDDVIEVDGCTLDLAGLRARRERDDVVELSALEVALLRFLHRHRGRAVSRAELLEHVWGHKSSMETRTVDMTVARLRKKIERDPADPRIVVGVRSVGYRWGSDD